VPKVLSLLPDGSLYHYRAVVTDVYDGDTVTVDLDLGSEGARGIGNLVFMADHRRPRSLKPFDELESKFYHAPEKKLRNDSLGIVMEREF